MSRPLELEKLNAYYEDSHVLRNVSFSLGEGILLGLLGRNGAGKSTCINSIIGLVGPRAGEVRIYGADFAGRSPEAIARRGVGLVPQGRRIFRSLSTRENLTVAHRPASPGAASAWTLEAILELFPALALRQHTDAGSLSGGEQQMLAIARALMTNPRILLMDEPSEGLAPQIVHQVAQVLLRLKAAGLSIILVEQNLKLALEVADDVVVLNRGAVVYEGPADGIRNDDDFLTYNLGVH